MNYRIVGTMISCILLMEAAFMGVPLLIAAFGEGRTTVLAFALSMVILLVVSLPFLLNKPRDRNIYIKESFAIVAGGWLLVSVFGSLPFYFSGAITPYINCLFESVSGFTTTGSSILTNIEALPNSVLYWRSFSHWFGGLGVLLLVLAIVSFAGMQSFQIMRIETTGPKGMSSKLTPKVRQTARILYSIYISLTVITAVVYYLCGMPLFDSILHAFSTAGTGGFSSKNISIAAYNSPLIEAAVTFFMAVFGINFNLLYLLILRKFSLVFKNEELRTYLLIMLLFSALVALNLCQQMGVAAGEALRMAGFQVVSLMTTTGFATQPFETWPQFSKALILIVMMMGGCAGSTAGGLKVIRFVLAGKCVKREVRKLLHPRSVNTVYSSGKPVEDGALQSLAAFFMAYMLVWGLSLLCLSWYDYAFETTITAVLASVNNIGPGLGLVGAASNYGFMAPGAKLVLIADMLLGRLEIYPILLLFVPEVWRRSKNKQVEPSIADESEPERAYLND